MINHAEALHAALLAYYRQQHALNAPPGMADAVITHRALADTRSTLKALNGALSTAELQLVERTLLTRLQAALQQQGDERSRELCAILTELLDTNHPAD